MQAELYTFTTDAGSYRYTSSSEDVVTGGYTYTAAAISRATTSASDDTHHVGLTITASADLIYALDALNSAYFGTVTVAAWDGDADAYVTIWAGNVTGITLAGSEAQITSETTLALARHNGLYAKWQVLCRHALYSPGCGLTAADFKLTGTVATIVGAVVGVTGFDAVADGYFVAGYLESPTGEHRQIIAHTGTSVTLLTAMPNLIVGDSVDGYAGCDHTLATCAGATFANAANYGGFPWLPQMTAGAWTGTFGGH